jgi:adenylate cyclase
MIVGNIGSSRSQGYTVMGDNVNLGSRLEGANRQYKTRCLISQATREAAGDKIDVREIDSITVKGRSEPSRVFELLGEAGKTSAVLLELREKFAVALATYRAGEWMRARQRFESCLTLHPGDGPSSVLVERCRRFESEPPRGAWTGVWAMEEK